MSILSVPTPRSKTARQPLEINEERTVSLRDAIAIVRQTSQVAFHTIVNGTQSVIVDVSRALALRTLRRLKGRVFSIALADVFGTLVIG